MPAPLASAPVGYTPSGAPRRIPQGRGHRVTRAGIRPLAALIYFPAHLMPRSDRPRSWTAAAHAGAGDQLHPESDTDRLVERQPRLMRCCWPHSGYLQTVGVDGIASGGSQRCWLPFVGDYVAPPGPARRCWRRARASAGAPVLTPVMCTSVRHPAAGHPLSDCGRWWILLRALSPALNIIHTAIQSRAPSFGRGVGAGIAEALPDDRAGAPSSGCPYPAFATCLHVGCPDPAATLAARCFALLQLLAH